MIHSRFLNVVSFGFQEMFIHIRFYVLHFCLPRSVQIRKMFDMLDVPVHPLYVDFVEEPKNFTF